MKTALLPLAALMWCAAQPAFAQLVSHPDAAVRIGHYHLNVTSVEAHKKFWADTLGGRAMKFGDIDVIEFPDAFIFLRVQKPAGPTRGTAFDHVGSVVPNVPAMATQEQHRLLCGPDYKDPARVWPERSKCVPDH